LNGSQDIREQLIAFSDVENNATFKDTDTNNGISLPKNILYFLPEGYTYLEMMMVMIN
jgi:hypothetical protein